LRAKEGTMAKILEFPKHAARSSKGDEKGTAPVARTKSAEIIIFPGVRIERRAKPNGPADALTSAHTQG